MGGVEHRLNHPLELLEYALLLIPVVLTIVYKYIPMYGIQIAFRDFDPNLGYLGSRWVGFDWFVRFFKAPTF